MTAEVTPSEPVRRPTARVLPVAPDGSVLLLRELDPARPTAPYWSSIGGGIEAGEQAVAAGVRELFEETGIEVVEQALIGPVHTMEHAFSWNHEHRLAHHTYFAVAVPRDVDVSAEHLQPEEVDTVLGAAWWRPTDLAGEDVVEPGLAEIMRAAVVAVEGAS